MFQGVSIAGRLCREDLFLPRKREKISSAHKTTRARGKNFGNLSGKGCEQNKNRNQWEGLVGVFLVKEGFRQNWTGYLRLTK